MKAIMLASLAAIAVQPFVYILLFVPGIITGELPVGEWRYLLLFSTFAALVAIPFVLVIGIPSLLMLKRFGRVSWRTLGLVGFIAATALPAFMFWPSDYYNSSYGGAWNGRNVDLVVDGEPTVYGWLSYLESVLWFGLHGLIGALVFFFVWRRFLRHHDSFEPTMRRGAA